MMNQSGSNITALNTQISSSASSEVGGANVAWFPDSEASHHLTNSSRNVPNATPYIGQGKICVGNGNTTHISHRGISQLQSNNRSVICCNIIIEPNITKTLLPAPKFH